MLSSFVLMIVCHKNDHALCFCFVWDNYYVSAATRPTKARPLLSPQGQGHITHYYLEWEFSFESKMASFLQIKMPLY